MIEELGNKINFFGPDIPGSKFKMYTENALKIIKCVLSMRWKSLSKISACAYDHAEHAPKI